MAISLTDNSIFKRIFAGEINFIVGFTINYGPYRGINGYKFYLQLDTLIQRIVFKTKKGYPHGSKHWIHCCEKTKISSEHFVQPLQAIGVEYGPTIEQRTFVPLREVICCLGTLATPALLIQSGIGPRCVLESLGIPVLYAKLRPKVV